MGLASRKTADNCRQFRDDLGGADQLVRAITAPIPPLLDILLERPEVGLEETSRAGVGKPRGAPDVKKPARPVKAAGEAGGTAAAGDLRRKRSGGEGALDQAGRAQDRETDSLLAADHALIFHEVQVRLGADVDARLLAVEEHRGLREVADQERTD